MIIVVRKRNVAVILTVFLLALVIMGINFTATVAVPTVNTASGAKTVILDPGHGGEDPGAVSDYSGISEKNINLNIATKVKEMLVGSGYNVIMTREEDTLQYNSETRNIVQKRKEDLLRRKKIMDESGADIVVSIHLNKFPQTQYFGAQTFFPPNSPASQKLAASIQQSIKESVDPGNKREALVKKEPIIILKDYKTTTAIVECGFLSNQEEEKKLGDEAYQSKMATAIFEGIKKYFQ